MTTWGYIRVSTTHQDHDMQKVALSSRYKIDKWVSDTGTGTITQPNLESLLTLVKQEDSIIVYAFDRLGRNTANVVNAVQSLMKRGVSVISMREGIDLSSPAGTMVFQMLCSIAEFESTNNKERIRAGLRAAAKRGVRLGKPPMNTYPEKMVSLLRAKALRASGLSCQAIVKIIDREGLPHVGYGTLHKLFKREILLMK